MRVFQYLLFTPFLFSIWTTSVFAETPIELERIYADGHGGFVYFPLGKASFADEVVSFKSGEPAARNPKDRQASNALSTPDYNKSIETGYLTLGCGGTLVMRFTDNALVDVDGPDLHVFEIGPSIEPTKLSISADGKSWIEVGSIAGGRADVDISPFVKAGEIYSFVKLVDLKSDCGAGTPGSDIDAVGAIGSGMRLRLGSEVLFDVGKAELKPDAETEIQAVITKINTMNNVRIVIEGHTDRVGSDASNQQLSEQRAKSVRSYMEQHFVGQNISITAMGFGEKRPIASNDSKTGRQQNRRVELIVIPGSQDSAVKPSSAFDGIWETSEGTMLLVEHDNGAKVVGRYGMDNGRVFFSATGGLLSGYWVEDNSSHACQSERDGNTHWGHMELDFGGDYDEFSGWWSYCESGDEQGSVSGERETALP